jgi:hypothetical protein
MHDSRHTTHVSPLEKEHIPLCDQHYPTRATVRPSNHPPRFLNTALHELIRPSCTHTHSSTLSKTLFINELQIPNTRINRAQRHIPICSSPNEVHAAVRGSSAGTRPGASVGKYWSAHRRPTHRRWLHSTRLCIVQVEHASGSLLSSPHIPLATSYQLAAKTKSPDRERPIPESYPTKSRNINFPRQRL